MYSFQEVDGGRTFSIDANNVMCPNSVFMLGPHGDWYEFDRADFMNGLKECYGLIEDPVFERGELVPA
jgi:hypothetical protein